MGGDWLVPQDLRAARTHAERKLSLGIDGAMSDATIYLNGIEAGRRPYGYSSFRVNLSEAMKPGEKNVLAIRLDNKDQSSRWYPGAGLYRDVWLVEQLLDGFIRHNGVFVTTPRVTDSEAEVSIAVEHEGGSGGAGGEVDIELFDAEGVKRVGKGEPLIIREKLIQIIDAPASIIRVDFSQAANDF